MNSSSLVALVYREKTGCRQYAFDSVADLEAWAARSPYKGEMLRVLPVKGVRVIGDGRCIHASEAAAFVRGASL
jgi:hypothetical protein